MSEHNSTPLRAAGYCRTSGENQRDNTSIPRQKEAIAAFCKAAGWLPPVFYVDECKSGAKVAGRADFQRMVRDATAGADCCARRSPRPEGASQSAQPAPVRHAEAGSGEALSRPKVSIFPPPHMARRRGKQGRCRRRARL
jgi:hypothetical protein